MRYLTLILALVACSEKADEASFESGLLLLENGHSEKAVAVFDAVLARNPDDADALVNRGLAKQDLGRIDAAIADYVAALAVDKGSGVAHLNRGTAWFAKGETLKAIEDYKRALAIDDEDAEAYRNRAAAWSALGMHDAAIIDYTQAMDLLEVETDLYRARGNAFQAYGNEVAAKVDHMVADATEALAADPGDVKARLRRGDLWCEMGEWADAVADYDTAIEAGATGWPSVYLARGRAHFVLGHDHKAIADFTKSIELAGENAEAHVGRALVHAHRGDHADAIRDYEAALAIDREATDAQTGLAGILATCPRQKLRDGTRAHALAKAVCEATKWERWYVLDVFACASAEIGAFDEAIRWEEKAIELAPDEEQEALKARIALFEAKQAYRSPGA